MRWFLTLLVVTGVCFAQRSANLTAPASSPAPSLVSFSSGALIVQRPSEYNGDWSALRLTDERPNSGWATAQGVVIHQVIVIEMAERSLLKSLEFDTGSIDGPGRGAKDILVEVSDTGAGDGFKKIAQVSLADKQDNQTFFVTAQVPGRWVRLTVQNNHGASDYLELMDFRAHGQQLTTTNFPDVSGTYSTNYGDMHLKQDGTSMIGCYEYSDGLLQGGIERRVMRLTWRQSTPSEGPAVMVFTADGRYMIGLWWYKGQENGNGGLWWGEKKSANVGTCPHWSGDIQQQMAKDLDEFGKTRVYGIIFDTDSDHIKDESHSTLDKIVALLKAKPALKLSVEGHTDSTGTPAHNQDLSERRAKSVVAYLTAAGIGGDRLSPAGFGATRPVQSNDTDLGRAQNRRVELVKK